MVWKIKIDDDARKAIKQLDNNMQKRVYKFIKRLPSYPTPRSIGKGLSGDHAGLWRYRVGDYRMLAEIKDSELIVLIVFIDHRSSVYN